MTWTPAGNFLLNQAIADRSTVKKHDLGTIVATKDPTYSGGEHIYLKGVASATVRTWVTYNLDDGTTTRLATGAIGPVAISMATLTASYYGWFQISGKALGACLTLYADNANVWITATAGSVDDASIAGQLVGNAKGASTTTLSSGFAEFEISRPWVSNRLSGS